MFERFVLERLGISEVEQLVKFFCFLDESTVFERAKGVQFSKELFFVLRIG